VRTSWRPRARQRPRPVGLRAATICGLAAALGASLAAPASADPPAFTNEAPTVAPASAGPDAGPDTDYQQYSGERILGLPKKPACTVVMTEDYPMANTAYGPDEPYRGKFKPGDCKGPWTRIVAHINTRVTGIQFDRIGWINLAGARIVTMSSQEPRGEGAGWVVQDETYDVTRYASLFTKGAQVEFNIANVVTGQYTGIFYSDLSFEFYDDRAVPPVDPVPDVVTGLPESTILADPVTQQFTIPADTTELTDEIYVKASGGCDEFWWAAAPDPWPGQCDGYPIREIVVSIDGQPAGLVNTYPALFTGANGPSWWHPIPAPRAYDLRSYNVDLGPFIGTLTDGQPHEVTYEIPERRWTDSNFVTVWSNLLIMRNPDSDARTTGDVTNIDSPQVKIVDHGTGTSYEMEWTHRLTVEGTTSPAGGSEVARSTTFYSYAYTYGASTNDDRYVWRTTSTVAGDTTTTTSNRARYRLVYRPTSWLLRDHGTTVVTNDGAETYRTRLNDRMRSETRAGTPSNRWSKERWAFATSGPLGCGTTVLIGTNPVMVKNAESARCRWRDG
jgi:hypothetical protein